MKSLLVIIILALCCVYSWAIFSPPAVESPEDFVAAVLGHITPSSSALPPVVPVDNFQTYFNTLASEAVVEEKRALESVDTETEDLPSIETALTNEELPPTEAVAHNAQPTQTLLDKEAGLQDLADLVERLISSRKQATTKADQLEESYRTAANNYDNLRSQLKASESTATEDVITNLAKQLATAKLTVVKTKLALKSTRKEARKLLAKIRRSRDELRDSHTAVAQFRQGKFDALRMKIDQLTRDIQIEDDEHTKYKKQELEELKHELPKEAKHLEKLEKCGKVVDMATAYISKAREESKQRTAQMFAELNEKATQATTEKERKAIFQAQFRLKVKLAKRKLERVIEKAKSRVNTLQSQIQHVVATEDRAKLAALLDKIKQINQIIAKLRSKLKALTKRRCIKVDSKLLCNVEQTYYQGARAYAAKGLFRKCYYVKRNASVVSSQRNGNTIQYNVKVNAWVKICQSYPKSIIRAVKRIAYERLVESPEVQNRFRGSHLLSATTAEEALANLEDLLKDGRTKQVYTQIVRQVKLIKHVQKLLFSSKPEVSITNIQPETKSQSFELTGPLMLQLQNATSSDIEKTLIAKAIEQDIAVKYANTLSTNVVKTVSVRGCNGKLKRYKIKIRRPYCKRAPKQIDSGDAAQTQSFNLPWPFPTGPEADNTREIKDQSEPKDDPEPESEPQESTNEKPEADSTAPSQSERDSAADTDADGHLTPTPEPTEADIDEYAAKATSEESEGVGELPSFDEAAALEKVEADDAKTPVSEDAVVVNEDDEQGVMPLDDIDTVTAVLANEGA